MGVPFNWSRCLGRKKYLAATPKSAKHRQTFASASLVATGFDLLNRAGLAEMPASIMYCPFLDRPYQSAVTQTNCYWDRPIDCQF
jgi:hypothetical protein